MKTTITILLIIFVLTGCSTPKQQAPPQSLLVSTNVEEAAELPIVSHYLGEAYKDAHVLKLSGNQINTFPSGTYLRTNMRKYQVIINSDSIRINGNEFKLVSGEFKWTSLGIIALYEINGDKYISCQYCYEYFVIKAPD